LQGTRLRLHGGRHAEPLDAARSVCAVASALAGGTPAPAVGGGGVWPIQGTSEAAVRGPIADLGFVGLDDGGPDADPALITGYKAAGNRPLTRGQKLSNTALAAVRAPVEHGFAHLKNWRVLGKVRTDPAWATALVRALLVLTNREVAR
jgi:hypothetical protein